MVEEIANNIEHSTTKLVEIISMLDKICTYDQNLYVTSRESTIFIGSPNLENHWYQFSVKYIIPIILCCLHKIREGEKIEISYKDFKNSIFNYCNSSLLYDLLFRTEDLIEEMHKVLTFIINKKNVLY
jgi:hypothetical protein